MRFVLSGITISKRIGNKEVVLDLIGKKYSEYSGFSEISRIWREAFALDNIRSSFFGALIHNAQVESKKLSDIKGAQ